MPATGRADRRLILQVERDLLALARLRTLSSAARRTLASHQSQLRNLRSNAPAVSLPKPVARRGKFDVEAYLGSAGLAKTVVRYSAGDAIFSQGAPSNTVLYIQTGAVQLSVRSKTPREVIVALLEPGDFFGEGSLAGQRRRIAAATAIIPSVILVIDKDQMLKVLAQQHAMSTRFIEHMLSRNIRLEETLVDRFLNSSERRLARTLWVLAGSGKGKKDQPAKVVPHMSQGTLAKIVGTTRGRVNFFLQKFQRLGFIDCTDGLTVRESLLTFLRE